MRVGQSSCEAMSGWVGGDSVQLHFRLHMGMGRTGARNFAGPCLVTTGKTLTKVDKQPTQTT